MLVDIAKEHQQEVNALMDEAATAFPESSTGAATMPSTELREQLEVLGYLEQ